ncbi:MAG: hypothetical protein QM582_09405 [Micropruina sp.]|uniref:hypothetical protein n=1 Tax=Micropruina sp. TaxID=2737536 RepID=UPI0039E4B828
MAQTAPDRLLTVAEFATAIGKSRRTLQRWLDEGIIQSDMKLPGSTGAHLFRADRVDEFTTEAEVQS